MTEAVAPPPPKRGSAQRRLHPFPLFDTAALLQLLTENNIKHTWATLLQSTLLHTTPSFTYPPTPTTPPPPGLLASLLASLPSTSLSPPAALLPLLVEHVTVLSSTIAQHQTSGDGTTTKLLVRLADGELVESVIMRHRAKQLPYAQLEPAEEAEEGEAEEEGEGVVEEKAERRVPVRRAGRITLCVSSQIGCKQACTFCATGTIGLRGHLTAGEIVEQLLHANRLLAAETDTADGSSIDVQRVTNIVYMGQGEPLDNYAAVLSSIASFTNARLFHLSPSRITVSTVGLAHRIQSLAVDAPHVQLALSLHAPTQALRLSLVPSAASYTIERLMAALTDYIDRTPRGKRVLIEYVLLHAINDQPHHATQLVQLLAPLRAQLLVNLIPWNVTSVSVEYRAPQRDAVLLFQRLVQAGGLWCSVRQEMGHDVDGACGQLALKGGQIAEVRGLKATSGGRVRDIEDIGGGALVPNPVSVRKVRRRVGEKGDDKSSSDQSGKGEQSVADSATQPSADMSFDWRRSFALFLLPLLVIVGLSFCYR